MDHWTTGSTDLPPVANDDADPSATVASSLDWLYLLRRELLRQDISAMSLERRRFREEALRKFAKAEALLLAEM
jgi:hypothetical protein